MQIKIKKLKENAILPTYGSGDAAGADLYACIDDDYYAVKREDTRDEKGNPVLDDNGNRIIRKYIEMEPGQTRMIATGIAMAIPKGYVGLIFARSGLASKKGLAPANKVGVIDADYRGEIKVALHSHLQDRSWASNRVYDGDRIAQIVIVPYQMAEWELCEDLDETERGAGGFGSTGK